MFAMAWLANGEALWKEQLFLHESQEVKGCEKEQFCPLQKYFGLTKKRQPSVP